MINCLSGRMSRAGNCPGEMSVRNSRECPDLHAGLQVSTSSGYDL